MKREFVRVETNLKALSIKKKRNHLRAIWKRKNYLFLDQDTKEKSSVYEPIKR